MRQTCQKLTHFLSNSVNLFNAQETVRIATYCNKYNLNIFIEKNKILHAFCNNPFPNNKKVSRMYVHLFNGHLQNNNK